MQKTGKNIPDKTWSGRVKKSLLIAAGVVSLALGGIGAFLPILPTTPFVLLAAACFAASSPAMHRRLSNSSFFGEYLENYSNGGGVSRPLKARSLIFLWLGLAVSAAVTRRPILWVILALVGCCVSRHILMLKTKGDTEEVSGSNNEV